MSPFRVVALDSENNKFILAAMISTDKDTHEKRIYVIQKVFIPDLDDGTLNFTKDIAYAQATKLNSSIIETYLIVKSDAGRRYDLSRLKKQVGRVSVVEQVSQSNRTLFDCQRAAMEDYCGRTELVITQIL